MPKATILVGDCLARLKELPDDSIHSCVTDPPYELGFMGKDWDSTGIAYSVDLWREVLRVLKPGGHLIAFGGSRTYHRLAVAVEDAGFEVRDQGMWIYGSGFPKSLDVSKAIDKAAGAEREILDSYEREGRSAGIMGEKVTVMRDITAPATDDARKWDGWGTALKPAHEPFVIARKPFKGTVAANVLEHGTGAINVDGCRVGGAWENKSAGQGAGFEAYNKPGRKIYNGLGGIVAAPHPSGRFPANLIHDGSEAAQEVLRDAARFFYCAKASRAERGEGNNHPTVKPLSLMRYLVRLVTPPGGSVLDPFAGSGTTLLACIQDGFNAVGCELNPEYAEFAKRRCEEAAGLFGSVEMALALGPQA